VGESADELAERGKPPRLEERSWSSSADWYPPWGNAALPSLRIVGRNACRHHPRSAVPRVPQIGDLIAPSVDRRQGVPSAEAPNVATVERRSSLALGQVSVLLVEDDAIVRAWVRMALEGSEFRIAGEASSAADALELVERRRPALLLLDFNLPDTTGTELLRGLRARGELTPAIVMSAIPRSGLNEAAREAGAYGTVVKSDRGDELLATLRTVYSGDSVFDARHPRRDPGRTPLTPRERDVLRLVAMGKTNPEVALDLGVGDETVKTLLARIYVKLGVKRRAEAVAVAQRAGFL
jgi:two-component system, NarL family, response regulator DevR